MLEPCGANIYLKYKCPKCSFINEVTYGEVTKLGGAMCGCGYVMSFKPVETAKVQLIYTDGTIVTKGKKSKQQKRQKQSVNPSPSPFPASFIDESLLILMSMGWQKGKATDFLLDFSKNRTYNGDYEEMIREAHRR